MKLLPTATESRPPGAELATRLLGNRSPQAAFFCYHSISDGGPSFLSVPLDTFERQLAAMRRHGLAGAGTGALGDLAEGRRPPSPRVFLTFDDGYVDNHDTAAPMLAEYGFTATVFVLPPYVDSASAFDWPEIRAWQQTHPEVMRSMSWPMIEALAERGIEIGSHGCRHSHLPDLGDEALREELWSSREQIRARLGRCDVLAYPFGEWDDRAATAAADAGYSYAFSLPSAGQRHASPLSIPRINIDQRDRGPRFAAKLSPLGRRAYLSSVVGTVRRLRRDRYRVRHGHVTAQPGS
jgi:peptidoglycan/xylan/chitin deacetylase (PgdA/CDA1 family)